MDNSLYKIVYYSFWGLCFVFSYTQTHLEASPLTREINSTINQINFSLIESLQNSTSPDELLNALFNILEDCKNKNIPIPNISEGFSGLENILNDSNLEFTPDGRLYFENIVYKTFYDKNTGELFNKLRGEFNPRPPTQKQPEYKNQTLWGCLQCFAGFLMCLIPNPIVQNVGASIFASGVLTIGHSELIDTTSGQYNSDQELDLVRKKALHTLSKVPVPYGWTGN